MNGYHEVVRKKYCNPCRVKAAGNDNIILCKDCFNQHLTMWDKDEEPITQRYVGKINPTVRETVKMPAVYPGFVLNQTVVPIHEKPISKNLVLVK